MKHRIAPFPFGSREGELLLRVDVTEADVPDDVVAELDHAYRRFALGEVWLDAATLAGPHGRALGLALRGRRNTLAVGDAMMSVWPSTPGRIVLDVSGFLAKPVTDSQRWLDEVSRIAQRVPAVDEIFAVAPDAAAVTVHTLDALDSMIGPGNGATLYLTSVAAMEAAVDQAVRCPRPWVLRMAGPLQLSARAPAASPAG